MDRQGGGRGLNSNHRKSRAVPKSSSVTLISMQPIHLPNLIADYINRCYKWSNIVMDWHNQRPVQWIWPKGQKWTNKSWSINNLGWCVLLIFALNLEHFLRGNKERVLETFPVIYNVGNGKKSCGHERNLDVESWIDFFITLWHFAPRILSFSDMNLLPSFVHSGQKINLCKRKLRTTV